MLVQTTAGGYNLASAAAVLISVVTMLLSFSVAPVAAVTLNQYSRPRCYGNRAYCANIGPNICCESPRRVFSSASCSGCTSTDFHITWLQAGRLYCGRVAAATNGGGCISGSSNLRGHSWCRLCRTRKEEQQGQQQFPSCMATVAPDVLQIGTHWFQLNDSVPSQHRDLLWDLWAGDLSVASASLPAYMVAYERAAPSEEELAGSAEI